MASEKVPRGKENSGVYRGVAVANGVGACGIRCVEDNEEAQGEPPSLLERHSFDFDHSVLRS